MLTYIFFQFAIIHFFYRIINYIVIPKARYFVLHALFNFWVVYRVLPDTITTFTTCSNNMNSINDSGFDTTTGIMIFHLHHLITSWKELSLSDKLHHIIGAQVCSCIAFFCPQRIISTSNFFMCGFPGGIDYILLTMEKYNLISTLTEKRINCFLNLCIRLPGQYITTAFFLIYINNSDLFYKNFYLLAFVILAMFLHIFNAIYYADLVVRNYEQKKILLNTNN